MPENNGVCNGKCDKCKCAKAAKNSMNHARNEINQLNQMLFEQSKIIGSLKTELIATRKELFNIKK